jgi:hypothetical protein
MKVEERSREATRRAWLLGGFGENKVFHFSSYSSI